jgi:hypothetical protein
MLRELIPRVDQKKDKASFLLEVHTFLIKLYFFSSINGVNDGVCESFYRSLNTFSFYRRKYRNMKDHTKDGTTKQQNWCHG